MLSTLGFAAALSLSLAATAHAADTCATTTCDDVHFFLARGNNEPYPGRQGALVSATCDGLASCGYEDLIYSALFTDLSCQTTYDGAIAGITQMTAYAELCPHSKLILAGYSQGGQIVTDILGGGGGVSFNGCVQPSTPALNRDTSPGNRIVAAITFGDTRHTANQPYNFGTGSGLDGLFPRPASQLAGIDAYTGVLRDWCQQNDPICAANQTDSVDSVHLGYYNVYSDAAAAWIKSVASISDDSSFVTAIPTSVSGTVQDYATVGTATPSGTVVLDTTYTDFPSLAPCSSGGSASSTPSTTGSAPVITTFSSSVPTSSSNLTITSALPSGPAIVGTSAAARLGFSLNPVELFTVGAAIVMSLYM